MLNHPLTIPMWYTAKGEKEVAFECPGALNASILHPRVHFRGDTQGKRAFITGVTERGTGYIENPIFDENLVDDKSYKDYIKGNIVW